MKIKRTKTKKRLPLVRDEILSEIMILLCARQFAFLENMRENAMLSIDVRDFATKLLSVELFMNETWIHFINGFS
jgi:hypothetical protein